MSMSSTADGKYVDMVGEDSVVLRFDDGSITGPETPSGGDGFSEELSVHSAISVITEGSGWSSSGSEGYEEDPYLYYTGGGEFSGAIWQNESALADWVCDISLVFPDTTPHTLFTVTPMVTVAVEETPRYIGNFLVTRTLGEGTDVLEALRMVDGY
jgi:hypothetical protein